MAVTRRARLLRWSGDDDDHGGHGYEEEGEGDGGAGFLHVALRDFALASLWVWALATINLAPGSGWLARAAKYVLARFFIAWIGGVMGGGRCNPLLALSTSMSEGPQSLLACLLGRIPAQVIGYVIGVKLLLRTFPEYEGGPKHNVNTIVGVVVEGIFAFLAVITCLLQKEMEQSFFARTLISSISMLTLRSIASFFNGGWLNPGSAFGWAYVRGVHMTMQHLLVYWIAPFAAAMLGVRAYDSVVHPHRQRGRFDRAAIRWKSD